MTLKRTTLVTGAAGFIGSNLCHLLVEKNQHVIGIDALKPEADLNNLNGLWSNPLFSFFKVDLTDSVALDKVLRKIDFNFIVHLAAESHVDRSLKDASSFWNSNVIGTYNLLNICKDKNIEKIVLQETDEVYGERRPDDAAKEGDSFNPNPPYACSKTAQYFVGRSFFTTYNMPIVSTFPVNCFGPRQNKEKIIPKFITNLLNNKKVPLMNSTHFMRDWLPVKDMCEALIFLLDKGQPGEDYNVGAFNHCTNLELTRKILDLCDKDESFIEMVPDRTTHDSCYAVNCDKLNKLGFTSNTPFNQYLAETVEWYKNIK